MAEAAVGVTHTGRETAEIEQAIVASVSPETMVAFLRRAVPAMAPAERASLFTAMQLGAPRAVFDRTLAMARPHLSERAWTELMAALAPLPVSA